MSSFDDPPESAEVSGFARVLCVEPASGHVGLRSHSIMLPETLAARVNAERMAHHQALVRDRDRREKAAGLASGAMGALGSLRAPAALAALGTPRARIPPGKRVKVITVEALQAWRQALASRVQMTAAERKAANQFVETLESRGGLRTVGLRHDWEVLLHSLREDMPHFGAVTDRIHAALTLAKATRTPPRLPPLLLAGPPGVGKTHFAKRLAAVFGVPQFVYLLESAETVSVLCGTERHWSNAAPGELWKLVVEGLFANPVVVLEELARAAQGGHYRPAQALHALLDPVTSRELRDKAVELQFDASFVSYVATTNSLDGIESSLLSRFEVFHVGEPAPREAVKVSKSICKEVLAELKLCNRFAMPAGEVIQQLSLLGGPRQVQKTFRAAVARAVSAGRSSLQINDLMAGFQVGAPKSAQRQRLH